MSKKNRYKFRERSAGAEHSNEFTTVIAPSVARGAAVSNGAMEMHAAEYRIISKDLIRLVVLNGVMLAAVLAIYFTNKTSSYLERMFQSLF